MGRVQAEMAGGWDAIRVRVGRVFAVNLGLAIMLLGMASVLLLYARGDAGTVLGTGVGLFFLAGGAVALPVAAIAGIALRRRRIAINPILWLTGIQIAVALVAWLAMGGVWTVPLVALCANSYASYELARAGRSMKHGQGPRGPD